MVGHALMWWWELWPPPKPPSDLHSVSTGVIIDAAIVLLRELERRGYEGDLFTCECVKNPSKHG